MHEETATLSVSCPKCRSDTVVRVLEFVGESSSWFRRLPDIDQHRILELFDCSHGEWRGHPIIESHDDGHPYFGLMVCGACHAAQVLYVSFYERQPARYVATWQGAAELTTFCKTP
jgi:hypothetical protein